MVKNTDTERLKIFEDMNMITKEQTTEKKYHRGISQQFADKFRTSALYQLYKEHKDELVIGVRNDYINIYYNCDSIAKVSLADNGEIRCEINGFYLGEEKRTHHRTRRKTGEQYTVSTYDIVTLTGAAIKERIVDHYDEIKVRKSSTDRKDTDEKKAQQMLFMHNNRNAASHWFCIDLEWVKQFRSQEEKEAAKYTGRFDIVAISRQAPHRVAIVELKYGGGAIAGKSGVVKHLSDFRSFLDNGYYEEFREEVGNIVASLGHLGIDVPFTLGEIAPQPEFYFLTLNNSEDPHQTTKQKMAAYLFKEGSEHYREWNCLQASTKQAEWDVLDKNSALPVTCLFSDDTIEACSIDDIIDHPSYDRNVPK